MNEPPLLYHADALDITFIVLFAILLSIIVASSVYDERLRISIAKSTPVRTKPEEHFKRPPQPLREHLHKFEYLTIDIETVLNGQYSLSLFPPGMFDRPKVSRRFFHSSQLVHLIGADTHGVTRSAGDFRCSHLVNDSACLRARRLVFHSGAARKYILGRQGE
jgi:hypothetical protein